MSLHNDQIVWIDHSFQRKGEFKGNTLQFGETVASGERSDDSSHTSALVRLCQNPLCCLTLKCPLSCIRLADWLFPLLTFICIIFLFLLLPHHTLHYECTYFAQTCVPLCDGCPSFCIYKTKGEPAVASVRITPTVGDHGWNQETGGSRLHPGQTVTSLWSRAEEKELHQTWHSGTKPGQSCCRNKKN